MICHKLKCIFIHIPRCAGTSVETWLTGKDWWEIEPATKHLTAHQAQSIYSHNWNEYFKFSIVRNPVARFQSCMKYQDYFGLSYSKPNKIDFTGYHALFGKNVVVEHDHRFTSIQEVRQSHHLPKRIYGNILDVPLDFVARFESLQDDMREIGRILELRRPFNTHLERSQEASKAQLSEETVEKIQSICAQDYKDFGYE